MDFFRLRRESREILTKDANRLTLITAILIAASPLPLYLSVDSLFELVIFPQFGQRGIWGIFLEFCLFLNLTFLITLPLWSGLGYLASQMEEENTPPLTDVFHAFSNKEAYGDALLNSTSMILKGTVLMAFEWGVILLTNVLFENPLPKVILGVLLSIGVFIPWFLWASRSFLNPYLLNQSDEVNSRMRPHAASVGKRYWLGYFPRLTLSLLTFGILLLADTLPEMLIAYFRLCKKLNEFTTQSEELIK